jgi:hypothetical protein
MLLAVGAFVLGIIIGIVGLYWFLRRLPPPMFLPW